MVYFHSRDGDLFIFIDLCLLTLPRLPSPVVRSGRASVGSVGALPAVPGRGCVAPHLAQRPGTEPEYSRTQRRDGHTDPTEHTAGHTGERDHRNRWGVQMCGIILYSIFMWLNEATLSASQSLRREGRTLFSIPCTSTFLLLFPPFFSVLFLPPLSLCSGQLLQDELAERSVQLEKVRRAGRELANTQESPTLRAAEIISTAGTQAHNYTTIQTFGVT